MINKKFIYKKDISNLINRLKTQKKKIGLCHGVFDLIHYGHIKHFEEAKKKCDILFVSVTDGKFVNKGSDRPFFNNIQRIESLCNLSVVDYIILSDEPSSISNIKKIKPNFYFKGIDYSNFKNDQTKKIYKELDAVKKYRGKLIITQSLKFSSSNLIKKSLNILTQEQHEIIKKLKKKYSVNDIINIINSFKEVSVMVIGEQILDKYVFLKLLGKSGKDPFLTYQKISEETYLGGSTAICKNISDFSKKVINLTIAGQDDKHLYELNKKLPKNIKIEKIKRKDTPAILKTRFIDKDSNTKLLGVYNLDLRENNFLEEKKIENRFNLSVKNSDITIISDYSHGMLSNNLIKKISTKSKFTAVNAQVNSSNVGLHTIKKYQKADLLIINENELRHEVRSKNKNIKKLILDLSRNFKFNHIVVTMGSSGCICYDKINKKFYKCQAFSSSFVDKVGAGDSMLGILSICLFKKIDINLSLLLASLIASLSIQFFANSKIITKKDLINKLNEIY